MKNIYLIGFMGTGKTTVGKILAKDLNLEFLEMDEKIEKIEKKKIVDIFKDQGEAHFRELEKKLLQDISQKNNLVISCGGGLVCDAENLKILKNTGYVFTLEASVDNIYSRIKNQKHRPLLNVDNPLEKIKELLNKRKDKYNQAHFIVSTDNLSAQEVSEKIINILKKER